MNNAQQQQPAKPEWNFDISENDSLRKAENPSSNSITPNIPVEQHPSKSSTAPSNPTNPSKPPVQRSSTYPSKSLSTSASHDVDKANITNQNTSNISNNTKNPTNTDNNNNKENEEVHCKGRFTFKVKRQPSPSLSADRIDRTSSSENVVPQISSSPLFDSPRPLLNSSSSIVPQESASTDIGDDEEARLQKMVDQLTIKVDGLIEEGKEIKQDIMKLLKTVQVLTSSQSKH